MLERFRAGVAAVGVVLSFAAAAQPPAPGGLAAAPGDAEASLSWTDPADDNITGYSVRHAASWAALSAEAWNAISGSDAATVGHTVPGLTNGSRYYFQVRAASAAGDSPPSNVATIRLAASPTAVVTINDSGLRNALENQLGLTGGADITQLDLATAVGPLHARHAGISNLAGLEHAVNLWRLDLSDNEIADVSALGSLESLQVLDLAGNEIADVSALGSLASLTGLWLERNEIADVSALGSLVSLSQLVLSANEIADVSALGSLVSLSQLVLSANAIADVSALGALASLQVLDLAGNEIADVSALGALASLQVLDLAGNEIADVSALGALASLQVLDLAGNEIADVSALGSLRELQVLDLSGNVIADVSALGSIGSSLGRLDLSGNEIADVSALGSLPTLQVLDLSGNEIADVSALGSLRWLVELDLSGNEIADVSALGSLASLLQVLDLSGNEIADVSALGSLGSSQGRLDLSGNSITGVGPLVGTGFGVVGLRGNPLSADSIERHVPALRAAGTAVVTGWPVPYFPSAADSSGLLGFIRVVNRSAVGGEVLIDAADDAGERFGPLRLSLGPGAAVQFNSQDLETGNAAKGLSRGVGAPTAGDWRLALSSTLDIEVLSYVRGDGFVTSVHDMLPRNGQTLQAAVFNSASNAAQGSSLRLMNPGGADESVTVWGWDDHGRARYADGLGPVPAGGAATVTAAALENPIGGLGDGAGRWRLEIGVRWPAEAVSLLTSPGGHPSNLSTAPAPSMDGVWRVPLFPAADDASGREGFVRVINRSSQAGEARVMAVDDGGVRAGPVTLELQARRTTHFNSGDLERGNADQGLPTGVGAPTRGAWRLELTSTLDIAVTSYVRSADGLLTSMHDLAPPGVAAEAARVPFFNPGSNRRQVSLLRVMNDGDAATVTVTGIDDAGTPSGEVRLAVPAGEARTLTAADLEAGGAAFTGALGDGMGKWRLAVVSDVPVGVMSLLESGGRLANMSTGIREPEEDADGDGVWDRVDTDADNDGISNSRDALPFDATESVDTDGDGIGNLADDDDDNDGVADELDARPLDASGHTAPVVENMSHYRFVGEHDFDRASFSLAAAGDVDCDGVEEIVVGAPLFIGDSGPDNEPGAVYLISSADLATADAADGQTDYVVFLGRIAAEPRSWKVVGEGLHYMGTSIAPVGDINGDGCTDLLLGARAAGYFAGSAYLVSALDLPAADRADGADDGVVNIHRVVDQPGSYEFVGEKQLDNAGWSVAGVPDWDGDGFDELLIGARFYSEDAETGDDRRGAAYLLARTDLASIDAEDGVADGRIALSSVRAGQRSWQINGASGDGLGRHFATGDFDGDGRLDLVFGSGSGAVYVIAAADLPVVDDADGSEDGVVHLGHVSARNISWKFVVTGEGCAAGERHMTDLSSGDLDGDGIDDLIVSAYLRGTPLSYVVSASTFTAADLADGVRDRVVCFELATQQTNSLTVRSGSGSSLTTTVSDVDRDGRADVVFGNGGQGFVYVVSGSHLIDLGASNSTVDLLATLVPDGNEVWKFLGGDRDRLGSSKPAVSDLDRDGFPDLILGSYSTSYSYLSRGFRSAPGTAIVISTGVLDEADSADGSADGEIDLGSLVGNLGDIAERSSHVATTQFDDNLIVMEMSGEMRASLRYGDGDPYDLAPTLYETYEDAFDYLIFVRNLPSDPYSYICGRYATVSNAIGGIGAGTVDDSQFYGSAGKLKGEILIPEHACFDYDTLSHEIMHSWANFVLPQSNYYSHWGFTSANGILGGFDRSNLVDLGGGRYAAGDFGTSGNTPVPYSPIELYLAGFTAAEDVPDIWVANDGEWAGEYDDEHGRVFKATDVEEWSIERIVAENGPRVPSVEDSQKVFRVATVLIADEEHPPEQEVLAELSALLRTYAVPRNDEDHESFNFYETTGGRASLETGGLGRWRKAGAAVATIASARVGDSRDIFVHQRTGRFGGAVKRNQHDYCGTSHIGHRAGFGTVVHARLEGDNPTGWFNSVLDSRGLDAGTR